MSKLLLFFLRGFFFSCWLIIFRSPELNMWHLNEISFQYNISIQHRYRADKGLQKPNDSIRACNKFCPEKFQFFTVHALFFDQIRHVWEAQIRWRKLKVHLLLKKKKYFTHLGIIQKKSASSSQALLLVIFDKKSVFFAKSRSFLRHFWVKLTKRALFWRLRRMP